MRRVILSVALAAVSASSSGCNPKTQKQTDASLRALQQTLSIAAEQVGEGLSSGWESAKGAGAIWLEAARNLDAARSGCNLEMRRAYEIGAAEEYYLGRTLAAEHIADLRAVDLGVTHPVTQYVDHVGQFLVIASEVYGERNERERWKDYPEKVLPNRPWPYGGYHFIVLQRAEPNAFGGPGGAVLITTGLLAQLESEDELAAVLAHEIAHVQRGHGVEFLKAFMCQKGAQDKAFAPARAAAESARTLSGKLPDGSILKNATEEMLHSMMDVISEQAKALYTVGYPRGFELEADRIGLRYMELAGYDVTAMPRLFERLQKASKGEDEYGVTHPRFETRLKVVAPVVANITQSGRVSPENVQVRQARFKAVMAKLPPLPKVAER